MDKDIIYREDAMNVIRETMTELLRYNAINKKSRKNEYFLYKESLVALKKLPPA